MIKIRKPSSLYFGKLLIKYRGTKQVYFQQKSFEEIIIRKIDYNLEEELLIELTTFDGTQIMFSMISANLFTKENNSYELKEGQNFCDFELYYDDNFMVFTGYISYENMVNQKFSYLESFDATIILAFNKELFDIWVKHDKMIN